MSFQQSQARGSRAGRAAGGAKRLVALVVCLGAAVFCAESSHAGVNLKNGNFYISYTDLVVPSDGEFELKLTRTYNSKSTETGWFGMGWGSDFETYLSVLAGGVLVVHENGSGADSVYMPAASSKPLTAGSIEVALAARNAAGRFVAEFDQQRFRERLRSDAELRRGWLQKAVGDGLLEAPRGQVGALYFGRGRAHGGWILSTPHGYVRRSGGSTEYFDLRGRLVGVQQDSGDGGLLRVSYGKSRYPTRISLDRRREIRLTFNGDGRLTSAASWMGRASYAYDGLRLSQSIDAGGNRYRYDYDDNYNLTRILYDNGESTRVTYEPKSGFVSRVTDRRGGMTYYEYGSDSDAPDSHYWTSVRRVSSEGRERTNNRYEYWIGTDPSTGLAFTQRIDVTVDGRKTSTTYNPTGLPLLIEKGESKTRFVYDEDGRLREKTSSDGTFVRFEYHQEFNKITSVTNSEGRTTFDYDEKARLAFIDRGDPDQIELRYSASGKITEVLLPKRVLRMKYDPELGKPIRMEVVGVGTVFVEYDSSGEIKSTRTEELKTAAEDDLPEDEALFSGMRVSLEVTRVFQELLSRAKPAGVNLDM